ncbi:hypothetical protein RB653_008330 [Dictyostelium firmibasis]|uniref:Carrier domain-containing protein n=1 Tax=Dictyostelium firmibasis TaxID=79012 RepID=A0AAN7TQV8_9MYCE
MLKHIRNFLSKRDEKKENKQERGDEKQNEGVSINDIKQTNLVVYSCNGCGGEIWPPKQKRYACNECLNFDLCSECYRKEMILIEGTQDDKDKLLGEGYQAVKHYDTAPLPHQLTFENQTQFQLVYSLRGTSTFETMDKAFKYFSKRPCLGIRERVPITNETPNGLSVRYKWLTYNEVHNLSIVFAKSLTQFINRRDFISIYMDNCLEWYITDFASLWAGLVVVPLHHSSNSSNLLEILWNSESKCIVCSSESFKNLIELYDQLTEEDKLEKPIVLKLIVHKEETFDQSLVDRLPKGVEFKTWKEMIEIGESPITLAKYEFTPIGPNDLSSVAYTSGSTGVPKGVMKLDSIFNLLLVNSYVQFPNAVYSYNTLSHSQRLSDWRYIYMGGRVAIYSGDMNLLFDDLALVRPHSFWAVPRFWNLLYTQFESDLKQYMSDNPKIDERTATLHCYKGIRKLLGERINNLVTGGAPTAPEVLKFMRDCWKDINISNSYGLTEISGVCIDGYISDDVEFKIEPLPSFGYYPTDLPHPRGELVVKSSTMAAGYYKNAQLTSESFEGGWFKTGDVVELLGVRKVKIIDRIKHAFKLANGEFVTPEPLENNFVSLCIGQIFIYGNSLKTFLVAIVKPSQDCLKQLGLQDLPIDELVDNPTLKSKLLSEINIISKEKKLANYEIPKIITIDFTEWTIENKLITGSGKFNRGELYKFYKNKIDNMFETIDKIQQALRNNSSNSNIDGNSSGGSGEQFENYIKSILNLNGGSEDNNKFNLESLSFIQIGGDSLGAVKLSSLLKEKENIDISPSTILNQNFNLSSLSKLINEKESNQSIIEDLKENFKINWNEEMILDDDIRKSIDLIKSSQTPPSSSSSSKSTPSSSPVLKSENSEESFMKSVFITGVTGYLGTFLLFNLLENNVKVEKVYCLIRNVKNEEEGFKLVERIFEKACIIGMNEKIREKVVPVCGDLSKPYFGVSSETFKMLCSSIDMVIHNGAIVNMAYPYANMKSTNVSSTRDILRLCTTGGRHFKKLVYVSTVGVFFGNGDDKIDESTPPSTFFLDHGNGYNQTKLISDILVREAASLGLPTMIFRPGTIFSHTQSGFNNQNDSVGLIIKGILGSKSYPNKNDYTNGDLNLSPVDWVSSSMVSLIKHHPYWCGNTKIYHMVNDNRLPLETLCQFINREVSLEAINYSDWIDIQLNSSNNPLYSIKQSFKKNGRFPIGYQSIKNIKTIKDLESIGELQCQPVSDSSVTNYVKYLLSNSLIQPINK